MTYKLGDIVLVKAVFYERAGIKKGIIDSKFMILLPKLEIHFL